VRPFLFFHFLIVVVISLCLASSLPAQTPTPNANLTTVGLIPIPGWTTAAGAFDLASFDPENRIMYFADGTNHAIISVDTVTNALVSVMPIPNCTTANCPSGIQVAPDLQKLVVTSRQTTDWIYDLRTPGGPPAVVTVAAGSDELDYDPIHQRIYVANTTAPFFLTGIDLTGPKANTVVAQIALPGNPEQPRFNPNDGMIYLAIPTVGLLVIDPTAGSAGTGDIVATLTAGGSGTIPTIAACGPQGNDIDPVTNFMLIGCRGSLNGEAVLNLTTRTMLSFQPYPTSNDVLKFNPNNRRWYTGTGGNANNGGNCTSTNTGTVFPVIGVFAATPVGSTSPSVTFVGTSCAGRGGQRAMVDTITNNIYMNAVQYPPDPSSATSGQSGILVFNDSAPGQAPLPRSQAILGSNGTVTFTQSGRLVNAFASLQGLQDAATRLVVTTTVGNETVACNEAAGRATCAGNLVGDPELGGVALLANNGKVLTKGAITATPALVITDLTFSPNPVTNGGTFSANFGGTNLTNQTSFDVLFQAPGSSANIEALNWQVGASAAHSVRFGTPTGGWIITGVRAHQDPADHTGSYLPVSVTLTVQ
jgi:hypothetical protein